MSSRLFLRIPLLVTSLVLFGIFGVEFSNRIHAQEINTDSAVASPSVTLPITPVPNPDPTATPSSTDNPKPNITKKEEDTDTGKIVTLSAPDEIASLMLAKTDASSSLRTSSADDGEAISVPPEYQNVVTGTEIPEIYKVGQESKIQIKWKSQNDQAMPFKASDKNHNGKLDYIEWTVPHLSTQVFEIIYISKAFQLDENKDIISDIYDKVKTQDNNWAEVKQNQSVRVTFQQVLDNTKDITIHARPNQNFLLSLFQAKPKIEVYPVYPNEIASPSSADEARKDGVVVDSSSNASASSSLRGSQATEAISSEPIATFQSIDKEGTYKILLTNLKTPTDQFDLRVIASNSEAISSGIDFDYIVDPQGWLTNWSHRKKITIANTNVDADLTNFPTLVKITADADLAAALATGYDIRFTDSGGSTQLSYERESWTGGAGASATGIFWVKVPTVSHSANTDIYVYYGNASATTDYTATTSTLTNCTSITNAQCTWKENASQNFAGVWHLKETGTGAAGDYKDSTSSLNNSTNTTGQPTAIVGKINGGEGFNGSSSKVSVGTLPAFTNLTYSGWIKNGVLGTSNSQRLFMCNDLSTGWGIYIQSDNKVRFGKPGINEVIATGGAIADTTTWHHISVSYNVTNAYFYIDGVAQGSPAYTNTFATDTYDIGHANYGGFFNGSVDETRISSTARSAEWIKFEYHNQGDSGNNLTFASQENNVSWLAGWSSRKKITIDHSLVGGTTEDETNFPVLVSLTGLSGINTNGTDIRFTASDGSSLLPREVESYDATSGGTLAAWVKVPTLSHLYDTVIYMYYGNSGASEPAANSTYGSQNVWDSNFKGVWHLPNGSSLTTNDSTSSGNNGTNVGATATVGQIDGGASFDGNSHSITGIPSMVGGSALTASGWVNFTSVTTSQVMFQGDGDTFEIFVGGGTLLGVVAVTSPDVQSVPTKAITTGWHYVSLAWASGSGANIYIDSVVGTAGASATGTLKKFNPTWVGRLGGGSTGTAYVTGSIDEARISSTARSAGWIATEYANQNSPGTFYSTDDTGGTSNNIVWTNGSGDNLWSTAGNWQGGAVPTSSDIAQFDSSATGNVTIDTTVSVKGINIASGYTGTITQSSTYTITVGTSSFTQAGGTFTGGSGAVDINGNFSITAGAYSQGTAATNISGDVAFSNGVTFTKATGGQALTFDGTGSLTDSNTTKQDLGAVVIGGTTTTRTLASDVKFTNITINSGNTLDVSASNYGINVSGNWSNSGTFTARSGTVTLNGTAMGKTITTGGSSFYDLTFNGVGGGWTLQDATIISDVLTITNGTLNGGSVTLTLSGTTGTPFSNSDTFIGSIGTVSYTGNNGSGNTTVPNVTTYYNLTVNNSLETYVLGANTTVNNNLTITAGTLDVTASNYSLSVDGNWSNAGTFTARSGTVTLTGTGSGGTLTSGSSSFYNLTQNGTAGTYTLQDALSVTNNFTITAGTLDTKSGSNYGVTVGGNWSNAGIFTARSGTVTFTAVTSKSITNGASSFYNVIVNGVGALLSLQDSMTVSNNLTVTYGTLNVNSQTLNVTGNTLIDGANGVINAGNSSSNLNFDGNLTITAGSLTAPAENDDTSFTVAGSIEISGLGSLSQSTGKLVLDGTATGKTIITSSSATDDFYDLKINGTGGAWTLSDDLTINNTLTITAGTLAGSSYNLYVAKNWANNGGTFTAGTGTVTLNGTGSQTLASGGSVFYNLTQNGSGGTYTLQDALSVLNNLTITAGTLDVSTNNYNVTVGGTWSRSGTFVPRSGTLILTGTSTFNDPMSFYNLTINGSGKTVTLGSALTLLNNLTITQGTLDVSAGNYDINVAGNWSNAGTFTPHSGTVTFNKASGTQTLNAGSGGDRFASLAKTNGSTLQFITNPVLVDVTLSIDVDSTVNLNGQNLTAVTLDNNGILEALGSETISITNFDTNSGTVLYDGGSTYTLQSIPVYYNLMFNNVAGTWQPFEALRVNNNLTIASGTLNANGKNLTVTGIFSNLGNLQLNNTETLSLTPDTDSGTVTYTGTGTQTTWNYPLSSGNNIFYNLTLNAVGGTYQLPAYLTINNNLTLTNGILDLNGYDLTVTGNIVRTSGTFANTAGRILTLNGTSQTVNTGDVAWHTVNVQGGVTAGSSLSIINLLSIAVSKTLSLASYVWSLAGDLLNLGTINEQSGHLDTTASGFQITDSNFDEAGAISLDVDKLYLTLNEKDANLNGSSPDVITGAVSVTCGADEESLALTETGNATMIFRYTGGLTVNLLSGSPTQENGILECADNTTITAQYTDQQNNSDQLSDTTLATVTTRPTAPSGLTGTALSSTSIRWDWTDNSSNETGFKLYSSTGSLIGTVASGVTSYTESNLTKGTTYIRKVLAYNGAGNSAYTSTVTVVTPAEPNAPSNLTGTAISSTSITWSWTDNSGDETGFKLYDENDDLIATIATASAESYTESSLVKGTSYQRRVSAYNDDGISARSNSVTVSTLSLAPGSPHLISPIPGSELTTLTPSFSFGRVSTLDGIKSYTLLIYTDGSSTKSYTITNLADGSVIDNSDYTATGSKLGPK